MATRKRRFGGDFTLCYFGCGWRIGKDVSARFLASARKQTSKVALHFARRESIVDEMDVQINLMVVEYSFYYDIKFFKKN